jgi:four helix bundle protein
MNEEKNKGFTKIEDMLAWQKAKALTIEIYKITNEPLFSKDFGLKDQIRRAAVSVPSNIAEGFGRGGTNEFKNFLSISKGSLYEVKTQLIIAYELGLVEEKLKEQLILNIEEVTGMIAGLIKYLKNTEIKGSKYSVESNNKNQTTKN